MERGSRTPARSSRRIRALRPKPTDEMELMDLVGRFGPITSRFAPAVEPDEIQRVDKSAGSAPRTAVARAIPSGASPFPKQRNSRGPGAFGPTADRAREGQARQWQRDGGQSANCGRSHNRSVCTDATSIEDLAFLDDVGATWGSPRRVNHCPWTRAMTVIRHHHHEVRGNSPLHRRSIR